jgi:hypothetical protein
MVSVSKSRSQDIEQQYHVIMMKKLLFATCRNYWENDHNILLSTRTGDLIAELRQTQPTLREVQQRLTQVVEGLNKPEKYYPIAKTLFGKISKIYGEVIDDESLTLFLPSNSTQPPMNPSLTENNPQITEIVQTFEQDKNAQRIHKMLFALSKHRWENNLETLQKYPLEELIEEIYQNYPNLERVGINLLKIVKGLNKQGTYSKVADVIITQISQLYGGQVALDKLKSIINVSKQEASKAKATANQTRTVSPSKVATETRKHNFDYNPYQVRQRVMKYTNPLRVKMLLYYTLNSNPLHTQQEADGLLLKTYELDQMLMQVVREFKTIQELQDHLETTALAVSSIKSKMFKVDENLQVVKAVVMALKPLYETK